MPRLHGSSKEGQQGTIQLQHVCEQAAVYEKAATYQVAATYERAMTYHPNKTSCENIKELGSDSNLQLPSAHQCTVPMACVSNSAATTGCQQHASSKVGKQDNMIQLQCMNRQLFMKKQPHTR